MTELQLVLSHFNAINLDGIYAEINGKKHFITDLVTKYRREIKTKSNAKLRQQKIVADFNLVRDELVNEVENYCNDLFSAYDDVVVFINRTSVNVYDPITGTTAYTLLSPITHCVNLRSTKIELEEMNSFINKNGYKVCNKTDNNTGSLINGLKETKDVAECIFNMLTKLRYEI